MTYYKPTPYFYSDKTKGISILAFMLSFFLPLHIHYHVKNIFKHVLFYMHDIHIMAEKISLLIKKLQKTYFALPNYGSRQNHETFIYRIENQI